MMQNGTIDRVVFFFFFENEMCDNFSVYVIGTNRDFPIIDVLHTNCVHLFIDLWKMSSFNFSVLVTFSFVLLRTGPDHERYLKIGTINSFQVVSNGFIMNTYAMPWAQQHTRTHTQCRISLASRHRIFNDRDT